MKPILLGTLIVLSLCPSGDAAIRDTADAPAAFADTLVRGDVRAFEPLIDDVPMSDDLEWSEVRDLVEKYDCLEVRSWRIVSRDDGDERVILRVRLDAAGITRSARRHQVHLQDDWTLSLVHRADGWRIRTAQSTAWALARRLFVRDPAEWEAAIAAAHDIEPLALAHSLADFATFWAQDRFGLTKEVVLQRQAAMTLLAVRLARATRDPATESFCLRMRGVTLFWLGQSDAAAPPLAEAISLARQSGSPDEISSSLFCDATRMAGSDVPGAIRELREAASLIEQLDEPRRALKSLTVLANLLNVAGDYRGELLVARQLEEQSRRFSWREGEANGIYFRAFIYTALGEWTAAEGLFAQAEKIYREIRNDGFTAITLSSRAELAVARGDLRTAQSLLAHAIAAHGSLEHEVARYDVLLARSLVDGHRYAEAEAAVADAIGRDGKGTLGTQALGVQARIQLARGRVTEAAATARRALEQTVTSTPGDNEAAWTARLVLGQALIRSRKPDEAIPELRQVIDIIERGRAVAEYDPRATANLLTAYTEPYVTLADLLVSLGRPEEALAVAERLKARSLDDMLRQGRADANAILSDEEKQKRSALETRLTTLNRDLFSADASHAAAVREERDGARRELERYEVELTLVHPELRVGSRSRDEGHPPRPRAGEAILEYLTTERHTLLFVVTRRGVAARVIPISRAKLAARVASLRAQIEARDLNESAAARKLYNLLLAPAADLIGARQTLCLIPDGALWKLPFQLLVLPSGARLLEQHAVFYAPSLALLEATQRPRPQGAPGELLALGNPTLPDPARERARATSRDFQLGPLPDAENEVLTIGAMYPSQRSRVLTRDQARETAFKRDAGRYRVLHLAMHGLVDDRAPMYSALAMAAAPGDADDGLLESRELLGMHLRADVAVLSACDTAAGRIAAGEGVMGMSWAFLAAGCPTLVVSQWSAVSRPTAKLMVAFHRRLRRGASATEALREAELELLRDPRYRHPYYWAAFVVVGAP